MRGVGDICSHTRAHTHIKERKRMRENASVWKLARAHTAYSVENKVFEKEVRSRMIFFSVLHKNTNVMEKKWLTPLA